MTEKAPQFIAAQQNWHPNNWPDILTDTQYMLTHIGQNPITNQHLNIIQIPVLMCIGSADHMVTQDETIAAFLQIRGANSSILDEQPHKIEKMNGGVVADFNLLIALFFRAGIGELYAYYFPTYSQYSIQSSSPIRLSARHNFA